MKKSLVSVITVLILIITNFVLRYIHINEIENAIGIITNKLSENGLKLSYQEIRYDSFVFWKVHGQITKPVLFQERDGFSDKSSFEYISFNSILIDRKISISLSNKINTLINDAEGEHHYISTFTTHPQIDVTFKGYFAANNKFLRTNGLTQYFVHYIDHFYYHSAGHKAVKVDKNTNSDELIYTISNVEMKTKNQNTRKYDNCEIEIHLDEVKYNDTSFGEGYFDLLAEVGESNYALNANLLFNFKDKSKIALNNAAMLENIKPTHKLEIHNLTLSAEPYSLEVSGNAVVSKNKILPYFDIDLNIANFSNMLDFYSKFYNSLIVKAGAMKALSLRAITEKQKAAIFDLFKKIAKKSQNNNYNVNINKLKDTPIKIGKYPIDEVVEMYNDLTKN